MPPPDGPSAEAPDRPSLLGVGVERFDGAERLIHWTNATLFGVCIATAACLYVGPLATLVGRRQLVRDLHVVAGLLLPVPLLAGMVLPRWGRAFRADVRRLNRFGSAPDLAKFNAGQKLNAAFTAGAIAVMLATGAIMRWFAPFPLSWRTGATFVHDTLFLLLVIVITGHVVFATRDPRVLRAMTRGASSSGARQVGGVPVEEG